MSDDDDDDNDDTFEFGALMTLHMPTTAMIVIHTNERTIMTTLARDEYYLPITNSLPHTQTLFKVNGKIYEIFDVAMYVDALLDKYFTEVTQVKHDCWRAELSDDLLIIDIKIDPKFELKSLQTSHVSHFRDIDEIYEKSLRYWFADVYH